MAAFNASFFIHSFIRNYKEKKNSPTFLGDQRLQLALYDTRKAGPAPTQPQPAPARTTLPPKLPFTNPPRVVSPIPKAIPGPGPQTLASKGPHPRPPSPSAGVNPTTHRGFRDIEEAESSDSVVVLEGKTDFENERERKAKSNRADLESERAVMLEKQRKQKRRDEKKEKREKKRKAVDDESDSYLQLEKKRTHFLVDERRGEGEREKMNEPAYEGKRPVDEMEKKVKRMSTEVKGKNRSQPRTPMSLQ